MSDVNYNAGIGPVGLLGVAFVILKLTNVIDWSWWWVTLPFWGGAALLMAVGLIIGLFALLCYVIEKALD